MRRRPGVETTPPGKREHGKEPLAFLATRIPRQLREQMRLHCVTQEREMQTFITEAIRERLDALDGRRRRTR